MSAGAPPLCLPNRVAYVVSHSYPYSSNGYAVRTHEVARALGAHGHEVVVFNRPGRPWDIEDFPAHEVVRAEQVIDGVRYVFLPSPAEPHDRQRVRLQAAEQVLLEAFDVFRPGMVLAVSNWENAEPAHAAARRYGATFFYEQRGFWEMSRAALDSTGDSPQDDEQHELTQRDRRNELRVARAAQAVFTLNGAMRTELVARGLPRDKIHLVPNGIAAPDTLPDTKGPALSRADLGITARHLISYIGSLSAYEGVEDILKVTAHLRREGVDVAAMIVGSSAPKGLIAAQRQDPAEQGLRTLAQELSLSRHVHFVPQLPSDQVAPYYAMSDAIVLPRRRMAMTELVAPLKPYAAAAHRVPVFMTDMPPLDEVAEDIRAQLFPEGDIATLAAQLRALFDGQMPAHPTPRPDLAWHHRVQPMSKLLAAETDRVIRATQGSVHLHGPATQHVPFDLSSLPQVALANPLELARTVVCIGPGEDLGDDPGKALSGEQVIRASRQTLLGDLGREAPGVFVIDWAGIQADPAHALSRDWGELWSISNMRLNRQIMDACRIALDRGWHIQVRGPVSRSQAPLFMTVADAVEEITQSPTDPDQATADTTENTPDKTERRAS